MNILDDIVAHKRKEVASRKERYPVKWLEQSIFFETPAVSLRQSLLRADKSGIIAEFKRRSPSKGDINPGASVEQVTIGYVQAGASALSVLTDEPFFGGSNGDLSEARKFNACPILRKDFIVDEYQIVEAKSIGADAILLIAACLEKDRLRQLAQTAASLGLEVLMEVHAAEELDHWIPEIKLLGVNNRNLKTMTVSVQTSIELFASIPSEALAVSESGINDPAVIVELKDIGYKGFLMGEHFMQDAAPEKKCQDFIQQLRQLEDLLKNAIA
ncbi:MAG: indole-3-glycerol phosphate synthase TrpC [Haliscomenobacter sp.]|nr:indole-3-glycerol phosphate synthase TrpC [Haliscomenobacter sp.]